MSVQDERTRCVLLANLEPMLSLGMTRVLVDDGVDVVTAEGQTTTIVDHARRLRPDAVVLGLGPGVQELGARVREAAPATKLILWAQDESEMRVFDRGAIWPRRTDSGARDALLGELRAESPTQERG